MSCPPAIERHYRRVEIDFAIGNRAPLTAVARHFEIHRITVASYVRRMLSEDASYFDRLRLAKPIPRHAVIDAAEHYARELRNRFVAEAEAAFAHHSSI